MPASCSPAAAAAVTAWLALCLPAQLVIPPTHQPTFHGSDNVFSFAFAPDRPVLYAHAHAPSVNLWPNLVALWPELLGAVAALATLVFIIVAVRLSRRPRRRAVPYCRRCNYDLSAHVRPSTDAKKPRFTWDPAALCPECGAKLDRARPLRGRPLLLRLAPALALWLAIVGPYAAMWAFRLPRSGSASQWLDLSSDWAAEHKDHWSIRWLSPKPVDSDHVVEVDLASGQPVRAVATRSSRTFFPMSISPDGQALFLSRGADQLDAFSPRTGRVVRTVKLPGSPYVDMKNPAVIGFTPDGAKAYVQWCIRNGDRGGVVCWPWRSGGAIDAIVEEPAFVDTEPGNRMWPRIFLLRDHNGSTGGDRQGAPRLISIPNFMESYPTRTYVVRSYEPGFEPRRFDPISVAVSRQQQLEGIPRIDKINPPVFAADKCALLIAADSAALRLDLDSGEVVMSVGPVGEGLAPSGCGRYLATTVGSTDLRIWDTIENRCVLRIALPRSLYAPRPQISPDGRWVAAVCQGNATASVGPRPGYVQQVVIWDLRDHPLAESSSHDAPPPAPPPASPPP